MKKVRNSLAFLAGLGLVSLAHAQSTPVETIEGASTAANAVWVAIAGLSATAFVFAMIISFGRKGKK